MFEFLSSVWFLASVAAYLYVAVAVLRIEAQVRKDNNYLKVVVKAATWPVTIWSAIEKLIEKK